LIAQFQVCVEHVREELGLRPSGIVDNLPAT